MFSLANSSLLTWGGHGSVLVMYIRDVIIPESMHKKSIDLLHLVQPCTGVIFAAIKGSTHTML